MLNKSTTQTLIIDIRPQNDFIFSHLNLNLMLKENKRKLISYINVPGDLIENVAWKLSESLKRLDTPQQSVSQIFESRCEYEFLVLFDRDTYYEALKPNSKLNILKRAVYEFDTNKVKNEPLILDGGWSQWIHFYPGFTSSLNSTINKNGKNDSGAEKEED